MDLPTKQCRCCLKELSVNLFYKKRSNKDGLYSYCKICADKKAREFRKSHPNWKEHKKNYDKIRTKALSEKLSEQAKIRYEKNRKEAIQNAKKWALANPEKRKAIANSYKHRRRAQQSTGIGGRELAEWTSRQPKICYWCGDKNAKQYTVDHYFPLARGGKHEVNNLVIACKTCNLRKNAKDPLIFAKEVGRLF